MSRANATFEVFASEPSPLPSGKEFIWERCADCRQDTRQQRVVEVAEHDRTDDREIQVWRSYEILRCEGCARMQMRITSSNTEEVESDDEYDVRLSQRKELFPASENYRQPIDRHWQIPSPVREVYLETLRSVASSMPILTGIGIRAIVEAVCKEQKASGSNLEQRINDLVKKGLLIAREADLLHKTRLLGNEAAHEAKGLSHQAMDAAITVIDHLLHTIYVLPDLGPALK